MTFTFLKTKTWTSKTWIFETWTFETWIFETWTSETWTSKVSMSKTWSFEAWTFKMLTFESCKFFIWKRWWSLTGKTLLRIIKTWGVIFKTRWFVGETCFKVFTSTISTSAFTSFRLCSILDVFMMWISCFLTCYLFKLSTSFLSWTLMPQLAAMKLDDVSKDNIVGTPSIESWVGSRETHICFTTLSRANTTLWGGLIEASGTQSTPQCTFIHPMSIFIKDISLCWKVKLPFVPDLFIPKFLGTM